MVEASTSQTGNHVLKGKAAWKNYRGLSFCELTDGTQFLRSFQPKMSSPANNFGPVEKKKVLNKNKHFRPSSTLTFNSAAIVNQERQ